MNALDDRLTPADRCIEFFKRIHEKGVPSELHLYSQGGHGFDLGKVRERPHQCGKKVLWRGWRIPASFDEGEMRRFQ